MNVPIAIEGMVIHPGDLMLDPSRDHRFALTAGYRLRLIGYGRTEAPFAPLYPDLPDFSFCAAMSRNPVKVQSIIPNISVLPSVVA
ncbi:hypothetical protein [Sphingomonas sanguinis]|uniref:Uncharacterized protein n=1 Tax=Sphingomonas sanguinis TaxID=33051 RepID=A0A147JAP3_9SPHN|nr:hypothetical protein [Sphingomonas sanguinis]KTW15348.1 hypothetical protein NS258_05435 [Sphingomonas sanguinis]